jgi:putative phosphoesterase
MLIGLLSDAHGNLEAFRQAVALLRRLGAQRLYFLGDAVGYLPGMAVVDEILIEGFDALMGNHEDMLLQQAPISPARDDLYRLMPMRALVTETQREKVSQWPRSRMLDAACGRVMLFHGSPVSPTNGYVYPDSALDDFSIDPGSIVFMGHTHHPFQRQKNGVRYVNVGSCGLPRDAGALGCAALLDDETGAVRLLRFDIRAATAAALARVGDVHPAVRAVFHRPTPAGLVGDLI